MCHCVAAVPFVRADHCCRDSCIPQLNSIKPNRTPPPVRDTGRAEDAPTLKVCCCYLSYLSCFFYAEKSLLMIAELPFPDSMFGQIFQMSNYLFGAFSMSIILGQVVYL